MTRKPTYTSARPSRAKAPQSSRAAEKKTHISTTPAKPPVNTATTKPRTAPKTPAAKASATTPKPAHQLDSLQESLIEKDGPALVISVHNFTPDTLKQMEEISAKVALAALTAQQALAGSMLHVDPASLAPSDPSDPTHFGAAMNAVANSLAARPGQLIQAQMNLFNGYLNLWQDMARYNLGSTEATLPPVKDKRFSDPCWEDNPMFDMMRRTYLLTSDWINGLIASAEGVDPLDKRRAEFFTKLLMDAFAPSNFLISNPKALQLLIDSKGESLVRGMQQFADDLARGHGRLKISQSDYDRFQLGENVATTPGKVVFRNACFELLQYSPTTETVHDIPLLIFPPWINKFYILDLQPKNSLIRWLVAQGFSVFVVSWVNPGPEMAEASFEDYMFQGIYEAVSQTLKQTGAKTVNTVGYCIGGTLLGCTLAHMAAKGDKRIGSATFFTAQHDFSEAGDLLLFTNESWLKDLEKQMDAASGVLPGSAMADTFNSLRANDLVWSFFVSNYLMGKEPPAFDLLSWNADSTRMPKRLHMFYLRKFYAENALANGGLELDGVKIDLKTVKIPIYEQSGREDHIAPPRSVYKGSKLFGGPVTFMMAGSGHIAGVINPPEAQKYMYWTNTAHPDSLSDWQNDATEHPGSWWPHWAEWLRPKSGTSIPARNPSKGPLKPLADAPGTYVKVRS